MIIASGGQRCQYANQVTWNGAAAAAAAASVKLTRIGNGVQLLFFFLFGCRFRFRRFVQVHRCRTRCLHLLPIQTIVN